MVYHGSGLTQRVWGRWAFDFDCVSEIVNCRQRLLIWPLTGGGLLGGGKVWIESVGFGVD